GTEMVRAGDAICRGVQGELWPQDMEQVRKKYDETGEEDDEGWRKFKPKPGAPPVFAAAINHSFTVQSGWGLLSGKSGDYLVRSSTDKSDHWIVDKTIFEASYRWL
ncbi:MAG: PGDYG domain-containing protein, partial [Planctomycetota bacterium]